MSLAVWILAVAAGAFGQLIDAAAGMGFGAFSSSIMLAGGLSPVLVVSTVNLAKVGSGFSSGLFHWRLGNVRWAWVAPLAIPGLVGGGIAAMALVHLPDAVARLWVPVVLVAMGLLILRSFLFKPALPPVAGGSQGVAPALTEGRWRTLRGVPADGPSRLRLGGIGFVGGVLNGVSGAFGPFVTSSVLLYREKQPRYAVGTVSVAEFFVAAGTSALLLWRLNWATFRWQLPVALIVGAVLIAPLGAWLARYLPARALGVTIALVLVGINSWSIWRVLT